MKQSIRTVPADFGNIRHFPREPFIVTAREMLELLDGKSIGK